jgi:hypothetical protein
MDTEYNFRANARKYFDFLINEFGYSVKEELFVNNPNSDGRINYYSPTTQIGIYKDRWDFSFGIKPALEPEIAGADIHTILEALKISGTKLNINPVTPNNYDSTLKQYAEVLRAYCVEFILGDFSKWNVIIKHKLILLQRESPNALKRQPDLFKPLEDYIKYKYPQV